MTVCGFARSRDGSAFVWADSEGYIAGKPIAEPLQKLVVSPGNLVGIGHGYKTCSMRSEASWPAWDTPRSRARSGLCRRC